MGYPDLKSDETIVLTAQHVKVKSVPFELVLTNRRLIIIDSEKNVVPTQQISLVTIRNVAAGENAIRDPVITLTILTETSDTREMALTFVRQTAGERRREADEWVRALRKNISEAVAYPAEPAAEISAEARAEASGSAGGIKKKIETARPIKKIVVDTSHLPPKPVETTSLPEGSFCGRCGNRIPPGSTFCNRCGTKVAAPGEESGIPPVSLQQVASPVPTMGAGERKGRPLEQIIHSIEPLIEDSVPRMETPPPVPESVTASPSESAPASPPASDETPTASQPETPAEGAAPVTESAQETPVSPAIPPVPPIPPVPEAPKKKGRGVAVAAVLIIIIIAVIGGGYLAMKSMQAPVAQQPLTPVPTIVTTIPTPTPAPTPVPTTAAVTPQGTPQVQIPQNGVWAEIVYDQTYSGLVGIPGMQAGVSDTGDHFYRIPTVDGTVAISVQKNDGSGDELKVIVYNNGIAVKTETTSRPDGSIDLVFPLTTPTPTLTPTVTTTTPAANMTVNSTA